MMKRSIAVLTAIILSITLIACSNQPVTQPNTESGESVTKNSTETTLTESNEHDDGDTDSPVSSPSDSTIDTENPEEVSTEEKNEQMPAETTSVDNNMYASSPPVQPEIEPTEKVETTEPSTETEPVATEITEVPESTTAPEPETESTVPEQTDEPETTVPTEPEPSFDIDYWISFAKSYAERVGLKLNPDAIYCWDNPIAVGSKCKYTERDIKDCLDWYAINEDISEVWVWAEATGENSYELYIGYA